MKLSRHGKERMKERTDLKPHEYDTFFRNALRKGVSIDFIKDEEIKNYLIKQIPYKNKGKVKLYQDYVFIYSKNGKRLYTMWKLPDKYCKKQKV